MTYAHTILRNARSGNVKWTLRVALDRESYHAGDILQANVFLCVVEPVHCNGIEGYISGQEKVTWSEKATHRASGEDVYSQQNEFLNDKMIVAKPRMYGPGEYVFPVVYQLHSILPASSQLKRHPVGAMNSVHAQLSYVFHVGLNANQGVILEVEQEIVIQETELASRFLTGFGTAIPMIPVQSVVPLGGRLMATLDKPSYRPGEILRVQCRMDNDISFGGRDSITVFFRLFEDVSITVASSKRCESSRLLCEQSFQVEIDAPTIELQLELASVPNGTPVERSYCSSFVGRRHRLAVESFFPSNNDGVTAEMAVVIL
ncbi:hypothetical protein PHPALM_29163 [Phytophthora palmivora]|uniref:Arrestin-like N-terminal domain-containing protein n=1 Tax=Phytophthora palmivora TaxID=4796 RepID=A0A2P4X8A4_9STRA|nr:hypothetical protein PHPALM_29163 [Phytophthora palmivora]